MRIFILEDDSTRIMKFADALLHAGHHVDVASSVEKAKEMWSPPYDLVLLDHDLREEHYAGNGDGQTGHHFAKWLPDEEQPPSTAVIVHSLNPDGAWNILHTLEDKGYQVQRAPFGTILLQWLSRRPR